MSEPYPDERVAAIQRAQMRLYTWIAVLMLLGIGALTLYSIQLGPLVGPGVETSFGYAVALMFLMGATLAHCADRMYRLWPLGRKTRTTAPGPITDLALATFAKVVVVLGAGAALAYVLGGLIGAW
ncbi:MAG: hypothetical protein L3K15_03440 [Thermoplasmata archaeon]|nr:hypothetical protein [Thermoplasmata archaeon]